jgi:hypothetical protein
MAVLPSTMSRSHIRSLQKALNEKAYAVLASTKSLLVIDGDFGGKSINALKAFQTLCGFPVTGEYDKRCQETLQPFIEQKYLTEDDYVKAAKELSCELAVVKAVTEVEAKASGFFEDGSPVILFERHKFYSFLKKAKGQAEAERVRKQFPGLCDPTAGGYLGGMAEHTRLRNAVAINKNAAFLSASWGLFQIMGFNHTLAAYATVEDFVIDMEKSERYHLSAFIGFVKSQPTMWMALRAKNWKSFAGLYNGPQYYINKYDEKLAKAYDLYK